tara:strand:+ start:455 stop:2599 length:2145 start_codon:yes stop_codon:yes gene_type:complete
MKKLLTFLIILIIISSPVFAFSIKDFLLNFRGSSTITGYAGGPAAECTNGDTQCGTGIESDCVTTCMDGAWVATQCCADYCVNGQCSSTPPCTNGDTKCGTGAECGGDECILSCSNNVWVEWEYCSEICSNGECTFIIDSTQIDDAKQSEVSCLDGTPSNQCSNNKPQYCIKGNLINNCNTCGCPGEEVCQETTGECNELEDPGGDENNDPEDLNFAPEIVTIEDKTLRVNGNIQFIIWVIDNDEEDILTYRLRETQSEVVSCSIIEEDIVSCRGIAAGEETITVIVSDGTDEDTESVSITVLPFLREAQPGVAAGLINTPPVANAGLDIEGISGQKIILDASLSYDEQGLLSLPETYRWYEKSNLIGKGKIIGNVFSSGTHQVNLIVTDSEGLTDEDKLTVAIKARESCKNTQTVYYPEDTPCNNKWPIREGEDFRINSETAGACSLFEVCSEDLDYVVEDSIKCCSEGLTDSKKISACNFAKENSETFKNCQATYVIKSLGKAAIYMKDYFDAEMCCKGIGALCPKEEWLYTPQPLPEHLKGVHCSNTPSENPNGLWRSDTELGLNEIALFDAPAHSSINILKTGTCVDYSVAAATLLRKIGFSKDQVMSVEASDHAYNLIRFDLDRGYTLFDMTGNNEGLKRGKVPPGYDYCGKIVNCYNDLGKISCPSNKEINGCEQVKERIGRTTGRQVEGIGSTIKSFWESIWQEIIR